MVTESEGTGLSIIWGEEATVSAADVTGELVLGFGAYVDECLDTVQG